MSNLNLSFAITPYDRVLPLITGEVKPSGIVLEYESNPSPSGTSPVPRIFFEQIKYQRYDVSEMSFSSYLIERAKGWPYVALPVFHNRNFRYTGMIVRDGAGIRQDTPASPRRRCLCWRSLALAPPGYTDRSPKTRTHPSRT